MASIILSCNETDVDCSTVLCAGPPSLVFEVLANGENVFGEGIYTTQDISLSGTYPSQTEWTTNEVNLGAENIHVLAISSFDWQEIIYEFTLNIGNEYTTDITVAIENSSSDGCCGGIPRIKSLKIDEATVENPYNLITLNF
ncbi:hypothetical protein [Flagellimonas sp. 2504JD1-5]